MIKTEAEFVEQLTKSFSKHFKVKTEVFSKCRKGRIDILLSLPNNIHFGLECKKPDSKRGEQIGEYVKQAIRYTEYEFEVHAGIFKKIPIFICPPLSYKYFLMNERSSVINNIENVSFDGKPFCKWHQDRHEEHYKHHSFNGFLGAFNVGEVRKHIDGSYFFSVSNKTIFSTRLKWNSNEINGLHHENYTKLLKKLSI
jgi:hypothetical protein